MQQQTKYYDLTAKISEKTVVFPGDPEYKSEDVCSLASGSQYHLCHMHFGNHTGTHIDFPSHVIKGGKTSSDFPIESLIGSGLIIRKKSRMGCISRGFHFLGVNYPPTRMEDKTKVTPVNDVSTVPPINDCILYNQGGGTTIPEHQAPEQDRIVPHPRTLRKAREQVKAMVETGFSIRQIRIYLHRFVLWWVTTSDTWQYHELIHWFIESCWEIKPAAIAAGLLQHRLNKSHTDSHLIAGLAA